MGKERDATYQVLGAEALLRRLRALTRHIEGVHSGREVEPVHKMRVAGRRLRTALRLFRKLLPSDGRGPWRDLIRQVTRRLGPARDLDVQIQFVSEFSASIPDPLQRPGVECLLDDLRRRRADCQPDVQKAVKQLRRDPALREIRKSLGALRRTAGREFHEKFGGEFSSSAFDLAERKIVRRLRRLLRYEPWVLEEQEVEKLHEMRIAAKRLRYAMEIFEPLWGGALDKALQTVKSLQRLLGALHDCDMWIAFLPDFLADQREKAGGGERLQAGIDAFLDDRRRRRGELFAQFVDRYRDCQAGRFWEKLRQTLRSRPSAGEPPEADIGQLEED
jgi:CHAD domain-containing protein